MHPLLVFFALLGGVKAFGVLGLFIGPVVLSLALVVFEMLREENAPLSLPELHQCSKYLNSCVFLAAAKASLQVLRMQFS